MPLPRRRRVAIGLLAALVVDVGVAAVTSLPASAARSAASAGTVVAAKAKAVATLAILNPSVSVRRKGKDEFKPATDGQKVRVGDTVQTDAEGFAQVNYTDESFTRLDVNTTFTIESLTDEAGNRKIKGSVETGQTFNRTSALTESESFEQEGAGATAAVIGTAFVTSCTTPQNCTFTSLVHGITLTTVDGEIQNLDPLEECDSTEVTDTDANLCGAPSQLTLDAIAANKWILENLYLDGLAGFEGIIVVENGVVVSVTPTTPPTSPPNNQEVPAGPPPVIDGDNPVLVEDCGFAFPDGDCGDLLVANNEGPNPDFAAPGLFSQYGDDVYFKVNGSAGESGLPFFIVFTATPDADFGAIWNDDVGEEVAIGTQYAAETLFRFQSAITEFTGTPITDTNTMVQVVNSESASEAVEVPITVDCDFCC